MLILPPESQPNCMLRMTIRSVVHVHVRVYILHIDVHVANLFDWVGIEPRGAYSRKSDIY